MKEKFIWVEKFRPDTVNECIVPKHIKTYFSNVIEAGDFQHLLLYSATPGTGKTTVARALCEEMGLDYIIINGSGEGRLIETWRGKVDQFASSVSMIPGKKKVVIVDESDGMPADPAQKSLRASIEKYSSNCRFIFTANYPDKLLTPIRSRLTEIDFNIPANERKDILIGFAKRCCSLLDEEGIEYDKRYLMEFISKNFPDFRKTLNRIQKYVLMQGKVDEGILVAMTLDLDVYIEALKEKDFTKARKWLAENEPEVQFYSLVLDELYRKLHTSSLANIILTVAKYQYQHSFAADPQVQLAALTVELMAQSTWK